MIRDVKYVDYEAAWSSLHGSAQPTRLVRIWLQIMYLVTTPLIKFSPNHITVFAGALACLVMYVASVPALYWLVAVLILLLGVLDSIDGVIAVRTGKVTQWGTFLDSFVDRIVDVAIAVALFVAGAPLEVTLLALTMTLVHEYMRARAASVGYKHIGIVTVAEKPTRILLGVIAFSALSVAPGHNSTFLAICAWVWLGLASLALAQLFAVYRRKLRKPTS